MKAAHSELELSSWRDGSGVKMPGLSLTPRDGVKDARQAAGVARASRECCRCKSMQAALGGIRVSLGSESEFCSCCDAFQGCEGVLRDSRRRCDVSRAGASALEGLQELEELEAVSCCREQGPEELGHWRQTKPCIRRADGAIEACGIERCWNERMSAHQVPYIAASCSP